MQRGAEKTRTLNFSIKDGRLTVEAVEVCLDLEPRLVSLLLTRYTSSSRPDPAERLGIAQRLGHRQVAPLRSKAEGTL